MTDAAHFLGSPDRFWQPWPMGSWSVPGPCPGHEARVRELVGKCADQPMDLADACLVVMSELWWECKLVTVDTTDFKVYRRRGRHAIPLLTPPGM